MCGFAGAIESGCAADRWTEQLRRMGDALRHRGPDAEGTWQDVQAQRGAAFAHRRLAIIDLSTGDQPLRNEDETVVLVYNGEIYNHDELRRDLQARGHEFRTRSDTEVLVYMYREYGLEMFERLNGMFAIALADMPRRRVVLARDRLGIKPFFVAERDGTFLWGSEIKCILAHPMIETAVDVAHLPDYFFLNYMPPDRTLFEGIGQLRPGELAVLDDEGIQRHQWWDLSFEADDSITEAEAIEHSMALLDDAVRMRLMSDVPFGAFLSGGIDSSAIVAMMARHMDQPVKTFSIGFEEKSFDERPYARRVAERYGTDHHELVVQPEKEILDLLPMLVEHTEEPTAEPTDVPAEEPTAINGSWQPVPGSEPFASLQQEWDTLPLIAVLLVLGLTLTEHLSTYAIVATLIFSGATFLASVVLAVGGLIVNAGLDRSREHAVLLERLAASLPEQSGR